MTLDFMSGIIPIGHILFLGCDSVIHIQVWNEHNHFPKSQFPCRICSLAISSTQLSTDYTSKGFPSDKKWPFETPLCRLCKGNSFSMGSELAAHLEIRHCVTIYKIKTTPPKALEVPKAWPDPNWILKGDKELERTLAKYPHLVITPAKQFTS